MTLNGVEHTFHVATTDEWDALRNAYNQTTGPLKYKEFSNGENVEATNASGLSLMLGGIYGEAGGFEEVGNYGFFMTSNDKVSYINKDNISIGITNSTSDTAAPTRLIKID